MSSLPVEAQFELLRVRVRQAIETLDAGLAGARAERDNPAVGALLGYAGAYGYANATMGQAVVDLQRALEDQ